MANILEARRARLRALINSASAGGRIASIVFTKLDGSERRMVVNVAAGPSRVKGEAASPSAQQAAATRAANHPEFMNLWDVGPGKRAFRTVNLDTVSQLKIDGVHFTLDCHH